MDKDQLYTEHMDEMFGITSLDNLTEEDVDMTKLSLSSSSAR